MSRNTISEICPGSSDIETCYNERESSAETFEHSLKIIKCLNCRYEKSRNCVVEIMPILVKEIENYHRLLNNPLGTQNCDDSTKTEIKCPKLEDSTLFTPVRVRELLVHEISKIRRDEITLPYVKKFSIKADADSNPQKYIFTVYKDGRSSISMLDEILARGAEKRVYNSFNCQTGRIEDVDLFINSMLEASACKDYLIAAPLFGLRGLATYESIILLDQSLYDEGVGLVQLSQMKYDGSLHGLTFNELDSLDILENIATGLNQMHRLRRINHLDIKPGNVMYKKLLNGKILARISDFGTSQMDDDFEEEDKATRNAGTPSYMTFHSFLEGRKKVSDGREDDIYALGLTAYGLQEKINERLHARREELEKCRSEADKMKCGEDVERKFYMEICPEEKRQHNKIIDFACMMIAAPQTSLTSTLGEIRHYRTSRGRNSFFLYDDSSKIKARNLKKVTPARQERAMGWGARTSLFIKQTLGM